MVLSETGLVVLRVSSASIPGAAVAGAQLAEGDQLQVQLVLQLPGLLPQICKTEHRAANPGQPELLTRAKAKLVHFDLSGNAERVTPDAN